MRTTQNINILVACEESQRVCIAFRERGFNAFSCDIQECSGGHSEWHIKEDVVPILNGDCDFVTQDGERHHQKGKWDMIIAHPPCTYLTITGNKWFNIDRYGYKAMYRYLLRLDASDFFMSFVFADCPRIAIENPIGYMSSAFRKPDQIIQPYMFGDPERKSTCLWLKNLPLLKPTDIVEPYIIKHPNGKTDSNWHYKTLRLPKSERSKLRSQTFQGIANAMAEQWGRCLINEEK